LWSERQAWCVGAADGQQPTAVGTSTTVAELWQIVGALGRCCLGYLRPSDDPSRSLNHPLFMPGAAPGI
jgi:hypothetical protein